jgi:acetyltransferase-like isoleucine patch superfamily enzyme
MVGIGAVVIGNVLPGESVFGNPARKFSIREIPEAILVEYKDTN